MPSCRPSTIIRMSPSQKLGIAWPTMRQHGDGAVDPGVLAHRRQDAERDRDDQREAQAHQAEREGDRHALGDQVRDAVLEEVALAEIADQRAADPVEELHVERAVEAVGLADDLDVGLRRATGPRWRSRDRPTAASA